MTFIDETLTFTFKVGRLKQKLNATTSETVRDVRTIAIMMSANVYLRMLCIS